jgi:YhcN/YlaJ family sporulation lipoprotein
MLKYCGVLVLSIILAISSAGCGMGNNVKPNEYQPRSANRIFTQDRAQNQVRTYAAYDKNISDKITKDVSRVSGIRKATVIVYVRTAIVGIAVSRGQNTTTVEHKVAKSVKTSDPGYDVHVTANQKLYTRIESIRNQIALHPNHDYSGDIRTLIRDIDGNVTAPTPTPYHWYKPTPTPTPNHWHKPTPAPKPAPKPAPPAPPAPKPAPPAPKPTPTH